MKRFFAVGTLLLLAAASAAAQHAFIPAGSDWRYLDNGSDQGTAWRSPAFNDAAWQTGLAQLGYGDGDETTIVSFGPNATSKYITTYFRRAFWVTNANAVTNLVLRLLADDGAVVYINGTEIARQNMPAGPVSYLTTAAAAVEDAWMEIPLSSSVLVSGQNLLAAEIHQVNAASSDLSFDAALIGSTGGGPIPPTIVRQPQSQTAPVGSTVTFSVLATGTQPLFYRWRRNSITVQSGTNATLTIPNVQTNHAGVYSVIVSNIAGMRISSNAVLTVTSGGAPTVTLTRPSNGSVFPEGAPIIVEATASDSDGTVTRVEFFAGTTPIGDTTSSTGTFTTIWSNAPAGNHQLTAVATDNSGLRTTSAPVQITVGTVPPSDVVLVPRGSTWRYLDDGSDQGTAWVQAGFDDSSWSSGPAQLGFGDGDETTIIRGGFQSDPYVTAYFRRTFFVQNTNNPLDNVQLHLLRDDGAVVYINGVEVARQNMPAGPVSYNTLATTAVGGADETTTFYSATVPSGVLVSGLNVIAVEIHQVALASSDLSFDFELTAQSSAPVAPFIITHPQSQTVVAGSDVTFRVDASGTQPLSYRWRRNGVTVPGGTNSVLTVLNVQTNALYSVLVSNVAGIRPSFNAILTVVHTNRPPIANDVSFTIAEDGGGATITLASGDPDPGTVLQYFIVDSPMHGTLTPGVVPYLVTYTPNPDFNGMDSFTWRAFDGEFFSRVATVSFTVLPRNDAPIARMQIENSVFFLGQPVVIALGPTASVILDGSESTDIDGDSLQMTWWLVGDTPRTIATGIRATNELPAGTTAVFSLIVTDGAALGSDSAVVTALGVCDAINLLEIEVNGAALRRQTKRVLTQALRMACEAFESGHVERGLARLEQFQHKVAVQIGEADLVLSERLIGATDTLIGALTQQ